MSASAHQSGGGTATGWKAVRCLPGVGPKSALRMAYHLLQRDRHGADRLARGLDAALQLLHHCARCNNFTEAEVCERCLSPRRDASQLCVVEMPVDAISMEQTHAYNGLYYVLMGRLSPLDGVGPRELAFERLFARAKSDPDCGALLLCAEGAVAGSTMAAAAAADLRQVGALAVGLEARRQQRHSLADLHDLFRR